MLHQNNVLTFKEYTDIEYLEESLSDSWKWFRRVIPQLQQKYAKFQDHAEQMGPRPTKAELEEFGRMVAPGGIKDLGLFGGLQEEVLEEDQGNILIIIYSLLSTAAGLASLSAINATPAAFVGLLVWSALVFFMKLKGWAILKKLYQKYRERQKAKKNVNTKVR